MRQAGHYVVITLLVLVGWLLAVLTGLLELLHTATVGAVDAWKGLE